MRTGKACAPGGPIGAIAGTTCPIASRLISGGNGRSYVGVEGGNISAASIGARRHGGSDEHMGVPEQAELKFVSFRATRKPTKKRPVGRPKIHKNNAAKCRAYRKRLKQRVYWR